MARFLATVTDRQLRSWKLQGYTDEKVAELLGTTTSAISRRLREIWREAYRQGLIEEDDPDPETIKERRAEVQSEWTPEIRERRCVGRGQAWTPAVVPVSVLAYARR